MNWADSHFEVCEEAGDFDDRSLVVEIGAADQKELVMAQLADALAFPEYFGVNWDATIDCLSDLTWLCGRQVVLRHAVLPLAGSPECAKYLFVLVVVLNRWNERAERPLRVCFAAHLLPSVKAHLVAL